MEVDETWSELKSPSELELDRMQRPKSYLADPVHQIFFLKTRAVWSAQRAPMPVWRLPCLQLPPGALWTLQQDPGPHYLSMVDVEIVYNWRICQRVLKRQKIIETYDTLLNSGLS